MKICILSTNSKLYSTKRLVDAARKRGHEVIVVNHTKCNIIMEKGNPNLIYHGKSLKDVHAVIPRIGASVTFFGAAVVRQFEMMKIFSVIESQALVRSRDKLRSLQLLSRAGIGIPKTAFAKFPRNKDVDELIHQVGGAPLIVKLLEGTQGVGVVLAETRKAAHSVIEAFSGLKENIIVQHFIAESNGADIRAFVVGNKVVGAMRRKGRSGDFRSNLHQGGKGTVIKLSRVERETALHAARCMKLSVAGVDLLQSKNGPLIIEVNSSPGLQGIETATKVDIAGKIIKYVEQCLYKKDKKK